MDIEGKGSLRIAIIIFFFNIGAATKRPQALRSPGFPLGEHRDRRQEARNVAQRWIIRSECRRLSILASPHMLQRDKREETTERKYTILSVLRITKSPVHFASVFITVKAASTP